MLRLVTVAALSQLSFGRSAIESILIIPTQGASELYERRRT